MYSYVVCLASTSTEDAAKPVKTHAAKEECRTKEIRYLTADVNNKNENNWHRKTKRRKRRKKQK